MGNGDFTNKYWLQKLHFFFKNALHFWDQLTLKSICLTW